MARLIVNADDYGFFPWVSAGILDAIRAGTVTATGVLANAPDFDVAAAALRGCPDVDTGVHLNATHGLPLTDAIPRTLLRPDGSLPHRGRLAIALLTGRLPVAAVRTEWRAQIERCVAAGLQPRFLNSHEHTHLLPPLCDMVRRLAAEFSIAHVRRSAALPGPGGGLRGIARSVTLGALAAAGPRALPAPLLLGLGASGRLDFDIIRRIVVRLRRNDVYELMCHPGRASGYGAAPADLFHYHDWPGELACFIDPRLRDLLQENAVRLVRYRDLNTATQRA